MSQLQDLFIQAQAQWRAWHKWKDANLQDAVDFMITEAVEVLRERLQVNDTGYTRNNPHWMQPWETRRAIIQKMGLECVDVIMMACRVLDVLGLDFDVLAEEKIALMTEKRRPPDGRQ